jgi:hypothetical protein
MATVLSVGDIAIVQYNSATDAFTFVFLRDVEAGTTVNFTDNGWLAAGGFRAGEGTVTYTAPSAITAGTIVMLPGLNLDDAGDQIIAYQGDPLSPTILYLVDLADGNNTVAGDATNDNTTALPPGFTLGVNAVGVAFDQALYAGPTSGSPAELFAAISNAANWIDSNDLPVVFSAQDRPVVDLDADNSTHGGADYRAGVLSGGAAVKIADVDVDVTDPDSTEITEAEIKVKSVAAGDVLSVNGILPAGIVADAFDSGTGILRLSGTASHADYETALRLVEFATTGAVDVQKQIEVSVFDGRSWSSEAKAFIEITGTATNSNPPVLDLDVNNSTAGDADTTATFSAGGPAIPVTDVDVSITDADSTTIQSATIMIDINRQPDDLLSIVGALPAGIAASSYDAGTGVLTLTGAATLADYQTALHQVAYSSTNPTPFTADRLIRVTVNDGDLDSNVATMFMHIATPPANVAPVINLDADFSTTGGTDYLATFTGGGPAVAIVDTDVLITDADDTEMTSATITLTNPGAGDVLAFNGAPPAGITVSSGAGVITLTGNAPLSAYQAALQQITFDGGAAPSGETRIIDVVVNDGTVDSNLAQSFIQVAQGNVGVPVVDLDGDDSTAPGTSYRTTFTENGTPIAIADADTSILDSDSTDLASAIVRLQNPQAGDLLELSGTFPGITASYDPGTATLTLLGTASLAEYEAALEAVLFSTSGDDPAIDQRAIEVVVNDGANNSQAAIALVTVEAINDAPALNVAANASYTENTTPVLLSPAIALTDPDDTEMTIAVVSIIDGSFPGDDDILTIGGATNGTETGSRSIGTRRRMHWSSPGQVRSPTTRTCCSASSSSRPATIRRTSTPARPARSVGRSPMARRPRP